MSWDNLKRALDKMADEGSQGFEGFVGELMGALLDQPFITARRGEQPGGDGRSYDGNVRFQTKHYTVATIPDFDIITDFHRIREAYPGMEMYVIGLASSVKDQLRSALDKLELEFGIEIPALDYSSESSPLSLLVIYYWDRARKFEPLCNLDAATVAWIEAQKQRQATVQLVESLRAALRQSTKLFSHLREAAILTLNKRFSLVPGHQSTGFSIDLSKAVVRQSTKAVANRWRSEKHPRLLVFEGAEGMGKSWLAAGCALEWAADVGTAVFFLESAQWAGCITVSEILHCIVENLPLPNVKDTAHWCRKVEFIWLERIVIILDGANESNALSTAQRLIKTVRESNRPMPRLVFTTRPLDRRFEYEKTVWRGLPKCEVSGFDDQEFDAALAALPRPLRREDIPIPLQSLARIPKFLKTCADLRERFGGLDSVTREMLIWADLLKKIEETEPQVRKALGWREGEEAAAVLAGLAAELLQGGSRNLEGGRMADFFKGDYREALVALEELRLAEKADQMRVTVTADCNILGIALLIRKRLNLTPAATIRNQSDEFRRFLEPLADADERINALYVALQLTAISPPQESSKLSEQRAALLHAWATGHNSEVSFPRLCFWANTDVLWDPLESTCRHASLSIL